MKLKVSSSSHTSLHFFLENSLNPLHIEIEPVIDLWYLWCPPSGLLYANHNAGHTPPLETP